MGAALARDWFGTPSRPPGRRGAEAVALVGDPGYYARFGFRPAAGFGLTSVPPIPAPFLQALPLRPGAEAMLRGVCLPLPE